MSKFKYEITYLAIFKNNNNGEIIFTRWIKLWMKYNYDNHENIHNQLLHSIHEIQLEGSGFQFECIEKAILEVYKTKDIQASSFVELPEKYKINQSLIFKIMINFFMVHSSSFISS